MFCAGVFFTGRMAWWLPLGTMVLTDIGLNLYYLHLGNPVFSPRALTYQLFNYASYAVLILLGRRFKPTASFLALLGGGILGALLFYLITNTASWFFNPFQNPEYTRTFMGWITALTHGTSGWPQTWEFFRNTFLSGGLFTGLFVGAFKLVEAAESAREKEAAEESEEEPEGESAPDEAKA
jgi:hypothetical protein